MAMGSRQRPAEGYFGLLAFAKGHRACAARFIQQCPRNNRRVLVPKWIERAEGKAIKIYFAEIVGLSVPAKVPAEMPAMPFQGLFPCLLASSD
jgi:hypothetical protein